MAASRYSTLFLKHKLIPGNMKCMYAGVITHSHTLLLYELHFSSDFSSVYRVLSECFDSYKDVNADTSIVRPVMTDSIILFIESPSKNGRLQ